MDCRATIKGFLTHCSRSYSAIPGPVQNVMANIVSDLDFLGTKEHFDAYKHASAPPFWAHKSSPRVLIPDPQKPAGEQKA
jgi:hypothetical protein